MTIYTLGHDGRFKEDILSLLRSANLLPGKIVHFHFPGFYYTTKMKTKKNKTRYSSVSPAFVGPYVPLAPVSRAERQRCSRTALSEVTHDLWLPTPKAVPRLWLSPLLPADPSSPAAPPPRAWRRPSRGGIGRGPWGRPSTLAAADFPLQGLKRPCFRAAASPFPLP